MIKQISVFVDNTPGSLAQFTRMLGEKRIDMISLSIADTANFGILRGLVRNPEQAAMQISAAGTTVSGLVGSAMVAGVALLICMGGGFFRKKKVAANS